MTCPTGQRVVGFKNNKPVCELGIADMKCPRGQKIVGFKGNIPICRK
jgi:hypothetical protein